MIRILYSKIRRRMPRKIRSLMSKIIFNFSGKPFWKSDNINPGKKFPNQERGGMIISADFELSWAFRYSKRNNDFLSPAKQARVNFPFLLELFERFNIPITWATVGHLFLDKCTKGDHDWMARIPYFDDHWQFLKGDWYDHDPYSTYEKHECWYAPDLIEKIVRSKVGHEVGCHTFSHINCKDQYCPPVVLDDEITACENAAKKYDIKLKSFVFPGGTAGNYRVLVKHGFKIYRKNIEVDIAYPFFDENGLLVTPTSDRLGNNGLGWDADYFLFRFKKYIDKAIKTNTVCHFWFHPSIDEWFLYKIFPRILEYADLKRKQKKLWIGTMGDLAEYIGEFVK